MNRENSRMRIVQACIVILGVLILIFSGAPQIFAEEESERQETQKEDNKGEEKQKREERKGKEKKQEEQEEYRQEKEEREEGGQEEGRQEEGRQEEEDREEDKQEEENQLQVSQICCEEPDGQNGWYLTAPEAKIVHTEPEAVTKYKMTASDGTVVEGGLKLEKEEDLSDQEEHDRKEDTPEDGKEQEEKPDEKPDDALYATGHIPAEAFKEGRNILEIWMISPETEQELFHARREILLDLCPPQEPEIRIPSGTDGKGKFFNSKVNAEVECEEDVSGVDAVFVLLEGKEEQRISGGKGTISISPGYAGKISAYAVDGAGRKSGIRTYGPVLCEDEAPQIEIRTSAAAGRWHKDSADLTIYVKDSGNKYSFSSGLCTTVCRAGEKTVASESWGYGEKKAGAETFHVRVAEASRGGNPVTVTVTASDRAGNTSVQTESLYIDRERPVVQVSGVRDGMIAGSSLKAVFTAGDENILESCRIKIQRTGMDNKTEIIEKTGNDGWEGTAGKRQTELEFSEDGKYVCTVSASDAAGHTTEKTISFVIDRTDPVIRYVEQLDGAYLPFFQWNYGKEMIRDLTENSFSMYLNGRRYIPGTRITEEGIKLLEVRARDQAGNEAFAEAVFWIDHTPPDIMWGEVKDGGVCKTGSVMTVWVEGEKERIKSVDINGKRQKTGYDSQIFQQEILSQGKYTVSVRAEDAAGNYTEESISFEAEAERERGILPAIFGTQGKTSGKNVSDEGEAETYGIFALIILASGAACAGGWIVRRHRTAGKRERH